MLTLFEHIRKVSPTDSTVLVLGRQVPAEIVARSVHRQHAGRQDSDLGELRRYSGYPDRVGIVRL